MDIKTCNHCGKTFIATHYSQLYCSPQCKTAHKTTLVWGTPPKPEHDIKFGELVSLLNELDISYGEYIKDRPSYIRLYRGRKYGRSNY